MSNVWMDPMMALIAATHSRSQIALGELSELANQQQDANTVLNEVRKLEDSLRQMRSKKELTSADLQSLRDQVKALKDEHGVTIDIEVFLSNVAGKMSNGRVGEDANGDENAKFVDQQAESIKEALASMKDQIRGQVSNNELDMQRMTQEVATATQLESTLSKRWSDLANTIVGNMRA